MTRTMLILACLSLSSCGAIGSMTGSLGSIGSLGSSGSRSTAAASPRANLPDLVPEKLRRVQTDQRRMIAAITSAEITRSTSGIILRVTGRPMGTDAYNADLVQAARQGDMMVLDLRMQVAANGPASPASVTVARSFSARELAGIRRIQIRAAQGTRTLRLR